MTSTKLRPWPFNYFSQNLVYTNISTHTRIHSVLFFSLFSDLYICCVLCIDFVLFAFLVLWLVYFVCFVRLALHLVLWNMMVNEVWVLMGRAPLLKRGTGRLHGHAIGGASWCHCQFGCEPMRAVRHDYMQLVRGLLIPLPVALCSQCDDVGMLCRGCTNNRLWSEVQASQKTNEMEINGLFCFCFCSVLSIFLLSSVIAWILFATLDIQSYHTLGEQRF